MFDNEIYSLETLKETYQNIISELQILEEYLNDYIKFTKDLTILNSSETVIISFNSRVKNIFLSLKSIQDNTVLNTDYGQSNKPFKKLNTASDSIKINYSEIKNINNINSLRLLPICKLSSFYIDELKFDDKNYRFFYINKLNRKNPTDFYQLKIPIISSCDLAEFFVMEINDALKDLEKIMILLELNIKRLDLGINHIDNISKINL